MGKKSKNRYAKFKAHHQPKNTNPFEYTSDALQSNTPTSTVISPSMPPTATNSYSVIKSWPVGKELQGIAATFLLLIIILGAVTFANNRTTAVTTFGDKVAHMLHIGE